VLLHSCSCAAACGACICSRMAATADSLLFRSCTNHMPILLSRNRLKTCVLQHKRYLGCTMQHTVYTQAAGTLWYTMLTWHCWVMDPSHAGALAVPQN
jgi:hypothetical protein